MVYLVLCLLSLMCIIVFLAIRMYKLECLVNNIKVKVGLLNVCIMSLSVIKDGRDKSIDIFLLSEMDKLSEDSIIEKQGVVREISINGLKGV